VFSSRAVKTNGGQCSQRSGAPVGPDGGTAKSPGPDGTAKCGPHPSWKPQDGRLCGGRRALQGKTFLAWGTAGDYGGLRGTPRDYGGLRGTTGDYGGLRGTTGDYGGLRGTAGDCGGRPGTASDCGLLPVTTGDNESYLQHFMTPFSSKYRNSSNKIKINLRLSRRDK